MREQAALSALLAPFPRRRLAFAPTPIDSLPRLSEALGGPDIMAKRDDMTGFAGGGNKVRQLEYALGDAVAAGADMLVVTGAVQSNYMRTAAAAAARLGMGCHLQFEDRVPNMNITYHESGNVLLDRLFGAAISFFPLGNDEAAADASLVNIAAGYRARGHTPYLLTLSADTKPLGVLGAMHCAAEILEQLTERNLSLDAVLVPSGSAATHVGMVLGLRLLGADLPVHGICVRRDAASQARRVGSICRRAEALIGCGSVTRASDIECHDHWLGPGYGRSDATTLEAMTLAGRLEGMIVDPVYTAKSLAGVIGLVRQSVFDKGQRVLWLHSGGAPAVFAYGDAILG